MASVDYQPSALNERQSRDRHRYSLVQALIATVVTVAWMTFADVMISPLFSTATVPDLEGIGLWRTVARFVTLYVFWYVMVRTAWNRGFRRAESQSRGESTSVQ